MKWFRHGLAVLPLLLLVALPLWLRPEPIADDVPAANARRVVVYTAHNESIRREFAGAFARWSRERIGAAIVIDWRTPGGASEIARLLDSQYRAGLQRAFAGRWPAAVLQSVPDSSLAAEAAPELVQAHAEARAAFLASSIGIYADVLWGGGAHEHRQLANRGYLIDVGAVRDHPELFAGDDPLIPATLSGEMMVDPEGRWIGSALAAFGICANRDRLAALGLEMPHSWEDLADPRLFGTVVLADPTQSGSIAACFERLMQQAMHEAVAATGAETPASLDAGWRAGFLRIKRLAGNARHVADAASRVVFQVERGEAAAGMCIDFYGKRQAGWSARLTGGEPRLLYATPPGGTSISADPIAVLRGGPDPEAARLLVDFVLSIEGQRLWSYRPGSPGGPERYAMRRWPIRRDLYTAAHRQYSSDPDEDPYALAAGFTYRGDWTGRHFNLLRQTIAAVVLDPREELVAAWQAIIAGGGPEALPEAMAELAWLPYEFSTASAASQALRGQPGDRLAKERLLRRWTQEAAAAYRRARAAAEAGR